MTSHTVHLVSPSGYCQNQPAAWRGVERLRSAGHQVTNTETIRRRFQRFAGTDAERLAEFNQLAGLAMASGVVLAVRGGYGASRLLPHIDYAALRQRFCQQPLALCGHSDFTALQLAMLSQSEIISFSGPMLAGNFGAETLSAFTLDHFWQALTSPTLEIHWPSESHDSGEWQGTLWGGNLAMICSLIGTPWLPQIENGILAIEDVNEPPFRVERMLLQLQQSGILARQRAIVTGSFTSAALTDYDNGFDFTTVWQNLRELTGLPVISDLAFGHGSDTVTLPLGAEAQLRVSEGQATLLATGHPVLTQPVFSRP